MAPHIQPNNGQTNRGLWARTATIDWCESNYEVSYYVAEFWNTISNLAFILPQLYQYVALAKYQSVELSFRLAYLSLALVGIGSLLFHMTLSRPMQMFDETSMILVSLLGYYLAYTIKSPTVNRRILITLLICYGLVFLSLYVFLVEWPIFHHMSFALLVYASVALVYQLKLRYGPYYKFWTVLILQHVGFAFWILDKNYCDILTQFREQNVPAIIRPAFQFHALWHLLMAMGSQTFICSLVRLRAWTKYKEEFVINFKYLGLWIVLEKVELINSRLAMIEKHREKIAEKEPRDRLLKRVAPVITDIDLNQNQVHNLNDLKNYSE